MPFLPPNQQRQSTEGHNTQYSEEKKHNERRCSGDETRTASSSLQWQYTLQGRQEVSIDEHVNTASKRWTSGNHFIIIIITDKWPKQ